MRKLQPLCVALCLLVAVTALNVASAAAQDKSLYDRLGGEAAISAVIDDFVGRVAADERINKKFARSNIDRVKFFLKQQVCAATGGPCKYTGRSMKVSHEGLGITEADWQGGVDHLAASLDKFKVGKREKDQLLAAVAAFKKDIVEK